MNEDNKDISLEHKFDFTLCIICQKRQNQTVRKTIDGGKEKLTECAKERRNLQDTTFSKAIVRILDSPNNTYRKDWVHHHTCYATFTSSEKIERLRKKNFSFTPQSEDTITNNNYLTRSKKGKTDWQKCLVCQRDKNEHLRLVLTKNMNCTLTDLSKVDYKLHIRISAVGDLIAAEAKYHSTCLLKLTKTRKKFEAKLGLDYRQNLPFIEVVKEVRYAASLEQVLGINDVWDRYIKLARQIEVDVPESFISRRSTFKKKLEEEVGDLYHFFHPLNREIEERQVLLIPHKKGKQLVADEFYGEEEEQIPSYKPANNDFHTLINAALLLRGDLIAHPGHAGFEISKEAMVRVIPDSLHLFMSVLTQGEGIFEEGSHEEEDDEEDEENPKDAIDTQIDSTVVPSNNLLSLAQDIVYAVSRGTKMTPKHIGLALTLHHHVRSKLLVNLLHKAGHCMSYYQVLKADCSLASLSLRSFDPKTGAVVPQNFKKVSNSVNNNSILHVTADNIDIIMDTLDGKSTFHATQMVAFQRGADSPCLALADLPFAKSSSFILPPGFNDLCQAKFIEKIEPVFSEPVKFEWYKSSDAQNFEDKSKAVLNSRIEDTVFTISRAETGDRIGWTEFNRKYCQKSPRISAVGYLPFILNPAHEFSTLYTVLNRCIAMGDALNQKHIVLTCDEQLYRNLIQIRWTSNVYKERIVLRMGGLHIALNFMQVIGKHMAGSGLAELWLESGILAPGSIAKVMEGKAYTKGMRAHKLTMQAFWRLLYPQYLDFLTDEITEEAEALKNAAKSLEELREYLTSTESRKWLSFFLRQRSKLNATFNLWWSYIDMVKSLLMFTRGIRAGDWESYRTSLSEMLPFIALYDHNNYFKSMSVYIADMHQLPPEVEGAFQRGDFAVQISNKTFAQVDPDQAQEWMVGACKNASGGIVGITHNSRALQRWALSLHWKSEISKLTFQLLNVSQPESCYKEESNARRSREISDEESLFHTMEALNLLNLDSQCSLIYNIATKDQGTKSITDALVLAKNRGEKLVFYFVAERLIIDQVSGKSKVSYHAVIPKNKSLTMVDLYKEKISHDQSKTIMKADREFLQTLIIAYDAGRNIDLPKIVMHELCNVPIALATLNGELRLGEKASLINALTKEVHCRTALGPLTSDSILIIDGMGLVNKMGSFKEATNFGEFADEFIRKILQYSVGYKEVHVVFDRYRAQSVKSSTRKKRARGFTPVRRAIQNAAVPLPVNNWHNFLLLSENKADLCRFLSEEIERRNFNEVEVIVAGGFEDETKVNSSNRSRNVQVFRASHEEADTRIILHAVQSAANNIVVMASDTDVVLLLIHHFPKMSCSTCWAMTGTAKSPKIIPVHDVFLKTAPKKVAVLMAFHALTGCDTTSKIATLSKTAVWKNLEEDDCQLLKGLGRNVLENSVVQGVEKFVVKQYKVPPHIVTADAARCALFGAVKKPEALPPTSDSLKLHIKRCHYQVFLWENAHIATPTMPALEDCGWKIECGTLVPVLSTLPPVPKACPAIVVCGCKGQCNTKKCSCRKASEPCLKMCKCQSNCMNVNSC